MKLLTIAIPTYNRKDAFLDLCKCIKKQLNKNKDLYKHVEIIIADDSDNNDSEICFKRTFKNTPISFSYLRGKKMRSEYF